MVKISVLIFSLSICLSYSICFGGENNNLEGKIGYVEDKCLFFVDLVEQKKYKDICFEEFANIQVSTIEKRDSKYFLWYTPVGRDNEVIYVEHDIKKTLKKGRTLRFPSSSPSGSYVAYIEGVKDQNNFIVPYYYLFLVDLSGKNQKIFSEPIFPIKPTWSSDGNRIFFTGRNFEIYSYDIKSKNTELLVDYGAGPSMSKDMNRVAFFSYDNKYRRFFKTKANLSHQEYNNIVREYKDGEGFPRPALFVINLENNNIYRVSEDIWIDSPGIWSPSGEYLGYNPFGDYSNRIEVVNVSSGQIVKRNVGEGIITSWK